MDYVIKETLLILKKSDKNTFYSIVEKNLVQMKSNIFFVLFLVNDILDYCLSK